MDNNQFDSITRTLGASQSRRGVLRTLGAAALGAVGFASLKGAASADGHKVNICHYTGSATNPYKYISVSADAVADHEAHGDAVTNLDDVGNCGSCGNVCTEPENATANCDDGCGFTCNENYELNETGDGCAWIDPCEDVVCTDPENGTSSCSEGECGITCNGGYGIHGNPEACCTCITSAPACYWMENTSGDYCWVPYPNITNEASCNAASTCHLGFGGCFKWSTDTCA